jgi:signal transduction histidine kinase
LFCVQALVALPAALSPRWLLQRRLMVRTSIAVGLALSVIPHVQTVVAGLPTELTGIAVVCTVTGMSLVMPWGPRGQAIVALANLIAYGITLHIRGTASADPAFLHATLDVNRIEAGRLPVQLAEVSLRALFDDMVHELQQLPHAPDVILRWDVRVDGARVRTDVSKLKIIVKNLVGNALKFTESGDVAVQARYDPHTTQLHLSVADTGVGIAADDLAHIFDMFRQVGDGHDQGGVGLGLYIVKRFVEQLDGTINVASAQGTGSTFSVAIPTAAVASESPLQQRAA